MFVVVLNDISDICLAPSANSSFYFILANDLLLLVGGQRLKLSTTAYSSAWCKALIEP